MENNLFLINLKKYKNEFKTYTGRIHTRSAKNTNITYYYPTIDVSKLSNCGLDNLIMDETIQSDDLFKGDITQDEYTKLYNTYCKAVFKPCIKIDENGNYIKDESGKYVLTRYDEYFIPDEKENGDRPISRDLTIGLDKNSKG